MVTQVETDQKREAAYPVAGLASCLKLGEALKELGGARTAISKSLLAQQLGMRGTLAQLLGAAKAFQIIEGRGEYSLTEAGKRYFLPETESDKKLASLEFLAGPTAYKMLLDRFDGDRLPQTASLRNILARHGGVPTSWVNRVASIFITAVSELGLVDAQGFLRYKATKSRASQSKPEEPEHLRPQSPSGQTIYPDGIPTEERIGTPALNLHNQLNFRHSIDAEKKGPAGNVWIFSEEGGTVRLETPNPLPSALWKRLKQYVDVLEPAEGNTITEKAGGSGG